MGTGTTDTTTRTGTPPPSSRSHRRPVTAGLGAGLVVVVGSALLSFGGVHLPTRALLHVGCAFLLVAAATLPDSALGRAGVVWRLTIAGVAVLAAVAVGLVPLPSAVLGFVAPGIVAARPDAAWATLSLDPERTVGFLCQVLLPVTIALVTAVWGVSRWRRRDAETAVLGFGAALVAIAAWHAGTGTTVLFGTVDTWIAPPARFFAPFLNANHLAATLLLPLPVAVGVATRSGSRTGVRVAAGALAVAICVVIVWTRSMGGVAAAGIVVPLALVVAGRVRAWTLLALAPIGTVLLVAADRWASAHDALTLHGRVEMWQAAFAVWRDHWFAGSGGGTFVTAVLPYRDDRRFLTWDHAHDDWIEWLSDTGLVGVLALLVVVVALWPRPTRGGRRAGLLLVGVLGVALHAVVDFPFQLPGIAMATAVVVAIVVSVFEERRPASPNGVRTVLLAAAGMSMVAAAWMERSDIANRAAKAYAAGDLEAVRTLVRVAPWRPEVALDRARREIDEAPTLAAASRFAWDPGALCNLSAELARRGSGAEAVRVADRAIVRSPSDWRTYVTRAQAMEVADREAAGQAWVDAVAHGAPPTFVRRGWRFLPVGLVWADAVEGLPFYQVNAIANELAKLGDPEAALLAYEHAYQTSHGVLHTGHVRLLMRFGALDQAAALLERALAVRRDPRHVELLAEIRDLQGRGGDAFHLWLELAPRGGKMLARAARAKASHEGPESALAWMDALALAGGSSLRDANVQLEHARLEGAAGRPDVCEREVRLSGLLDDRHHAPAAKALLQACLATGEG
jgi:O-antigen ligase/tetratricopeptide (TPR) repeat protein